MPHLGAKPDFHITHFLTISLSVIHRGLLFVWGVDLWVLWFVVIATGCLLMLFVIAIDVG
jgi:hypothetical protein